MQVYFVHLQKKNELIIVDVKNHRQQPPLLHIKEKYNCLQNNHKRMIIKF